MLGDININILDFPSTSDEYVFLLSSYGLDCLFNKVSRKVSGTCIDHFFAKYEGGISFSINALDLDISDHHMICCEINFNSKVIAEKNEYVSRRNLDYDVLLTLLHNENWANVYNQTCCNFAFDNFLSTLQYHIKSSIVITQKKEYVKLKPWMTFKLANKIKIKNKLSIKAKKHKNKKKLQEHFKSFSQSLKIEIEKQKIKYYNEKFDNASGNPKKQWSMINELLGRDEKASIITQIIDENDQLIVNDCKSIANSFNNFFHLLQLTLIMIFLLRIK